MNDTEMQRIKAICDVAGVDDIDELSDGFHTFRQLYYQRMMLFATIVKQNSDRAWKSLRHEDGELCFGGGWFIVGIDTPEGSYTYHYEDNYYSLFDCKELSCSKHWDGHTEKDVTRLLSLPSAQPECKRGCMPMYADVSDCISRQAAIEVLSWFTQTDSLGYTPRQILSALPSAQPEQRWIPVSERLPEENSDILVTYVEKDEKRIAPVNYGCGTWFDCFFNKVLNPVGVLAWMPLPEPYEVEEA